MSAKEYLRQLIFLENIIKEDREKVARLKAQTGTKGTSLSPDKVQTSPNQSRQADIVCEWVDLEQQIAEDEAKRKEICTTIQTLPPYEATILYKCYAYDKSLKEISRDMRRSYSWVSKIHSHGLKKIQRILDEREARGNMQTNDKR